MLSITLRQKVNRVKIALLGLGQVGKNLLKLLTPDEGSDPHGSNVDIVLAADSQHMILSDKGIDPKRLHHYKQKGDITEAGYQEVDHDSLFEHEFDVLVDLMPATRDGKRARDLYVNAFKNGRHVVTACKSGLANHWTQIMSEREKHGSKMLYEATVAGGLPFFSFMGYCIRSSSVVSIKGILNSSANFILKRVASGVSLEKSLEEARAHGTLEAEYHFDTMGFDSAWKTVIAANSIFGQDFTPEDINFEGVEDLAEAGNVNPSQRLVSNIVKTRSGVEASSKIMELAEDDPLLNLGDTGLGFTVTLDNRTPVTVAETYDGPTDTASAVLNDLLLFK